MTTPAQRAAEKILKHVGDIWLKNNEGRRNELKLLAAIIDKEFTTERRDFPIMSSKGVKAHPLKVPWSIAERAYSVYVANFGKDQSLQRISERGGFYANEMDEYCPSWREETSEITTLKAERKEFVRVLRDVLAWMKLLSGKSSVVEWQDGSTKPCLGEATEQLRELIRKG